MRTAGEARSPRELRTPGTTLIRGVLIAFVLLAAPRAAFACPVCFGENDSPLALGINYGILAMLGIIGGLWIAFGSFFIYLHRRARLMEAGALPAGDARRGPGAAFEGEAGRDVPHAQGGTV